MKSPRPWPPPLPKMSSIDSFRTYVADRVRRVLDRPIGRVVDVAAAANRFRVLVRLEPGAVGIVETADVGGRIRGALERDWPPEVFSVLVVEPGPEGDAFEAAWRLADLRDGQ